ncbi:MAG: nitrous oxide reductase family maturation protein NosD [Candidatus Hodarchaeota archaeon]
MTRINFLFVLIGIFFLFGISWHTTPIELQSTTEGEFTNRMAVQPRIPIQKGISTQAYIERGPITITSDSQINNSAVTGFKGNGTVDDPILIKGYNITDSSGTLISISGTTFFFQITNCLLNGMTTTGNGIVFSNVIHGTIKYNTIINNNYAGIVMDSSENNIIANNTIYNGNQDGIRIWSASHNNTVHNNTVYNHGWSGILLRQSKDNVVRKNTVYDTSELSGIRLEAAEENLIINNVVFDNSPFGISLIDFASIGFSRNNLFSNNTIYENNGPGIILHQGAVNNTFIYNTIHSNTQEGGIYVQEDSNNHNFTRNTFFNNNLYGIYCEGSDSNSIYHNLFYNNVGHGVRTSMESDNNNIQFNDFSGNNPGHHQAADDGSNNLFSNNFWSDWSGSGSYSLDSMVGNSDTSPLTNPYHLSAPIIVNPTGTKLNGSVTIQWTASSDTFGHSLTYSVLYSTDDGTSWTTLVSGLTTTNYLFNTTTFTDGTTILFKVQATDSIGFISETISENTFSIQNPTSSAGIPSILMLFLAFAALLVLRRDRSS